jgi:hypothetical protein
MTEKHLSKLVRESENFLSKHKRHKVQAPRCADSFYFNLWCVTCEKDISVRVTQGAIRDRAFKGKYGSEISMNTKRKGGDVHE